MFLVSKLQKNSTKKNETSYLDLNKLTLIALLEVDTRTPNSDLHNHLRHKQGKVYQTNQTFGSISKNKIHNLQTLVQKWAFTIYCQSRLF